MFVLALDTSTSIGSAALVRNGTMLAQCEIAPRMSQAALLIPKLDELFRATGTRLADVELFAVGIGPGSFSGVRIGIAAMKGFKLATHKPLIGVCSADAIAHDALARTPHGCDRIAVIMDARRGEFYLTGYELNDGTAKRTLDPRTVSPQALVEITQHPTFFVGPDNPSLHRTFTALPWTGKSVTPTQAAAGVEVVGSVSYFETTAACPAAAAIARLGVEKFRLYGADPDVEPIYLRPAVIAAPGASQA